MKVGLDFWNCISQHPDHYREMARALMIGGIEVYIISAYGDRQLEKYNDDADGYLKLIQSFGVPNNGIELVYFAKNDKSIPEMKFEVIQRLGIDIMIDDRPGTIEFLHSKGIMALQQPKPIKKA